MPSRIETLDISADELVEHARERGIDPFGTNGGPYTWVEPLGDARAGDIAFCRFEDDAGLKALRASKAGAVFVPNSLAGSLPSDKALYLPCDHPRLELLRMLQSFWRELNWTFDPAANPSIQDDAKIADDVRIGPFTVIGPGVSIGSGTRVGSNCHIERAEIGRDCIIGNNTSIGQYGFGYEDDPITGETLQFPHIGGVAIHDRVEIGSNTCIDRGSIGNTIIGDDCKIDNLIHVAHNVKMGKRCKVIALAIIGGSVELGDDAWIAPAAAIRDWCNVGSSAIVGLGAVVTKHVADGETVVGNPARAIERTKHRYK